MMKNNILGALLFFVALTIYAQEKPLKMMSANIRMATEKDGINYWNYRRDWFTDMVKFENIDVFGAQEVLYSQLEDIQHGLEDYAHIGVGRQGGKNGEFSPIFYKKDAFEVLESGTLWLSETPEKVGSKGWDAALPRIVTWAKFRRKKDGKLFFFFNTHFDHVGTEARKQSAILIRKIIADKITEGTPIFVTGDFNVPPSSEAYKTMVSDNGENLKLLDTKLKAEKQYGPSYTFNGFQLEPDEDRDRIDYIFFQGDVAIKSYQVLDAQRGAKFISDHFPVLVEVYLK
ncbi:endonuclease/exonuclease/phosphatase family protein [Zunongwangia pacifica]|uniref:Endonuclease/exonuclease/phosphatase family protein n=1 Tax=Zunongwangia pacifica TaxID=2911062 RepID=A0A9X2CNE3_9FLAO|nr:endonuclease/exonuclease/phosphatase family protein [Zunongwangia pacifica]MCL6220455.1 endonuclease/exonuclease/phosphatase family protein [Zunongwangia pacifica]